jgi:hypothetical protein
MPARLQLVGNPIKAGAAQISQDDDYAARMLVNAFAGFVGMLVMAGQWMLACLASMP